MKIFKRIYYPVLAVLFILMFTLSCLNATSGTKQNSLGNSFVNDVKAHLKSIAASSHNSIYEDSQEKVANYIKSQLENVAGIRVATETLDGDDTVFETRLTDGKPTSTYAMQRDIIEYDTLKAIAEAQGLEDTSIWEVNKEITNIVVYIPGTTSISNYSDSATGDVVMMIAHYDSRIEGAGATNNGTQVAAMLQNILSICKDNRTFENDLLFVFTDAHEEGMYGAYTFKHQFMGFDDVYSRVKMGVNFDALGNGGKLVMLDSSDNNYSLISSYGKISGNTFTSSALGMLYGGISTYSDFSIFDDIPSLSFANVGGREIAGTSHDTIDNVKDTTIIQHSNMMNSVIKTFGNLDLDKLDANQNAVYFSYLDAFTVVYPYAVSYVFGVIIILLAVGIVVLNRRNNIFKWTSTGSGAVVQILSIIGSVIVLFVLYYLISLFVSVTGFMSVRAIGRLVLENVGLLISFMLLSVVLVGYLSIQFRKLFNVNSADIVRGNVLVWGVIATILAFAAPHIAYLFVIPAVLELIVLLLITAFSSKFKNKFGMPIGKLFPYMIPMLIALPIIIPFLVLASMTLTTMFLPLLMAIFMMMAGYITPYCILLATSMEKIFAKLPSPSMRVEKEVTETIEDKAKKGKFVEKTSIIIVKEKYKLQYKHAYSAIILAVIFTIMATAFSIVGFVPGRNYTTLPAYRDAVYSSSMVLVWEKDNNSSESTYLQVNDFATFKFIDEAITGFSWNFSKDAFIKSVSSSDIIRNTPTITANGNEYTFTPCSSERSLMTLKLTDAANITKITIESAGGEMSEFENEDRSETIIINLPYKFGKFTLTTEGVDHINVEYTESIMDIGSSTANLAEQEDWKNLMEYYAGEEEVTSNINSGIVFKITKDLF